MSWRFVHVISELRNRLLPASLPPTDVTHIAYCLCHPQKTTLFKLSKHRSNVIQAKVMEHVSPRTRERSKSQIQTYFPEVGNYLLSSSQIKGEKTKLANKQSGRARERREESERTNSFLCRRENERVRRNAFRSYSTEEEKPDGFMKSKIFVMWWCKEVTA